MSGYAKTQNILERYLLLWTSKVLVKWLSEGTQSLALDLQLASVGAPKYSPNPSLHAVEKAAS